MSDKRRFQGAPAVRSSVPLWLGLCGPSGSGKTYSALRLAKGIQSVTGGKIGGGDTENGRMLHYAGEFDFVHYPFDPPFNSESYLTLLQQMSADGVTVAIIDSASHEHEGEGGLLEMHAKETELLAARWGCSPEKALKSAWIKPKAERSRMWQRAQRLPMHILWLFRAKRKTKTMKNGKDQDLGYMPIGGEELVYEMAMRALLLPGARGVPTWKSAETGEREIIKLPHWAEAMLRSGKPLDEELGAALAMWAKGDGAPSSAKPATEATAKVIASLLKDYATCADGALLESLEAQRKAVWKMADGAGKTALKEAADKARSRVAEDVL